MKVLIAVDGSAYAENAIKWYMVQHRADTEVIMIHVTEFPISPAYTFTVGMSLPQHEWDAIIQRSQEKADAIKATTTALVPGLTYRYMEREGEPGHVICDVAKNEQVDMVVIGTRGLGSVRRTLLGSVSDYVLHHAHAPVAICRH